MHRITPAITIGAALIAGAAVCAAPDQPAGKTASAEIAKGFLMKSVTIGDSRAKYAVYVPPSYDPAKPMPTIVFLNGLGECGTDGLRQIAVGLGAAVMVNVEKWPFIIVFPQKRKQSAAWEEEDAMVMATLEATKREYSVDISRIYLTGLSQGGHGTWTIAALHPDVFAAAAPLCGWANEAVAGKLVDMPVWAFHGGADEVVKPDGSRKMDEWIRADGGSSCRLTIYPDVGHNCWDKAYRDENLNEWFLEHHK